MKIDWKYLSTTPGYKSLKKAVVENIARKHRSKKETYQMFYTTINRAKHYAHKLNKPIEEVLNGWEEKRKDKNNRIGEWVIQFYPGHCRDQYRLGKLHRAPNVKPKNPINYYRTDPWCKKDPIRKKAMILKTIMEIQKQNSKRKGKKARWSNERKAREKRRKEYAKQETIKKASA